MPGLKLAALQSTSRLRTLFSHANTGWFFNRWLLLFCLLSAHTSLLFAQQRKLIRIATNDNLLLLGVDKNNTVKQLYFGQATSDASSDSTLFSNASPAYLDYGNITEDAALRITHSDGNLTTNLVYQTYNQSKIDGNITQTRITLKDDYYPDEITLCYKAYQKENIIEQWTEITHSEKSAITIWNSASASLSFQQASYYLTYYYGDWANETNLVETELTEGTKTIDSKLGVRTDQRSNQSFLLSLNGKLQENNGEVIGGTLAWCGNWQLQFNMNHYKKLQMQAGINPYASQYILRKDSVFKTPALLYTFSTNGSGEVTRRFHRWARVYGIYDGYGSRDVLLNNWEATYFDFDETKLTNIIREAGAMGFDLFLLDDGWFGNKYPRNNDDAGLGDWQVNTKKLPHGISYLAEQCKQNSIKFGIWLEPEMVNPKSELYEKHPDWVITAANRPLDPQRNQLILDLSNPAVQDFVYRSLENLVTQNKGISYIKWDCNRYITNTGSKYLGKDKQSHLFIEYPVHLLNIIQKFRKNFPDITLMVCSGGGGRIDYSTMPYFQEYWPSDNTDALDRIKLQWGLEYFYPAVGLASHVSVTPNHITGRTTPLKFRFDVAMTGKLGMDLQPMQMNAEEKEFSKKAIATYKSIQGVVLHGDLYRLQSPYTNDRAALSYVSEKKDSALVFNYLQKKAIYGDKSTIVLRGLQADAKYKITEMNKGSFSRVRDYEGKTFSGEYLMTQGLQFTMYNEYESNVLLLTKQ